MADPLISVLVPVYNVAEYLPECIESILAQTYNHFELVFVDDGSTDESSSILKEYASKDSRIHAVRQDNKGLAGARNTCLDNARGDYLTFVDSDDFIDTDYLSELIEIATVHKADISVCGRALYIDGESHHQERAGFANRILSGHEALRALNSYASFDMSMCGKLFKSALFDGLRFPEGKTSEDQFICYRLLLKSGSVYYQDKPLYHYRHRVGSISRGSSVNEFPIEASRQQLNDLKILAPDLIYAAETSCFFSQVAVYNAYLIRRKAIPARLQPTIKEGSRRYLKSVLSNPDLPLRKKIQGIVFRYSKTIYKYIFLTNRG